MQNQQVPLFDVVITEDELQAVVDVYRSGWLSMGSQTELLEAELAGFTGAGHALAVASGSSALQLICAGIGLRAGDEVVVPSMTFVATVSAVAHTGATPVFADIAGPREPWLSAVAAAEALGPRTKAILTMPYGGHAGELASLRQLANDNHLMLVEDAAHALGSRLFGGQLGTFGVAGAFSFYANKNLAVGEGGAVITADPDLHARMRLLRSHGMTPAGSGHDFDYDVVLPGFNHRIDEPRAALARRRLAQLEAANEARRSLDRRYRTLLKPIEGLAPTLEPDDDQESAHHLFVVVLDEQLDRRRFRAVLAERGIQTGVHYPPVHLLSAYRNAGRRLPATEAFGLRAVTLPMFGHMTERQQDLVAAAVQEGVSLARRR